MSNLGMAQYPMANKKKARANKSKRVKKMHSNKALTPKRSEEKNDEIFGLSQVGSR